MGRPNSTVGISATHAAIASNTPITRISSTAPTVALDDSGKGQPEGVVLRDETRSVTAKARFQDYERTLKRRATQR